MMYIIGVFLILLGLLMDEGTTLLVFLKGYGILESNPLYLQFGIWFFALSVCFHVFIIYTWGKIINSYKRMFSNRYFGYKLYDIFVFFCCFMIVFIVSNKIMLGMDNIHMLGTIQKPDTDVQKQELVQFVKQVEQVQAAEPEVHKQQMTQYYATQTVQGISYFELIYYVLFSFMLFKIGNKVSPWEEA
jgi:hypothetical protein